MTPTTEKEMIAEATATPSNPILITKRGVSTQVAMVQKIISTNVTFILPIALRALVRGVEIDDSIALTAKKSSEKSAGSHF